MSKCKLLQAYSLPINKSKTFRREVNFMTKINENTQYYHGYKFKIYPTKEQAEFIDQCIDIARFVYNWAIEQQEKQYQLYLNGKVGIEDSFISSYDMMHRFSVYRKSHKELHKCPLGTCRESIMNARQAYKKFFAKITNHPRFKSRRFFFIYFLFI